MNWKKMPEQIISYLQLINIKVVPIAKFIAISFSVFLIISIIIIGFKARAFLKESWFMTFKGLDIPAMPPGKIRRKWKIIKKRLESRDQSNYKMAVIEADKLLDNLLERAGYPGDTMAARLKRLTSAQISNLDAVWQAHKLRNSIVHDIEKQVRYNQARDAIEAFEKTLEELEVL